METKEIRVTVGEQICESFEQMAEYFGATPQELLREYIRNAVIKWKYTQKGSRKSAVNPVGRPPDDDITIKGKEAWEQIEARFLQLKTECDKVDKGKFNLVWGPMHRQVLAAKQRADWQFLIDFDKVRPTRSRAGYFGVEWDGKDEWVDE